MTKMIAELSDSELDAVSAGSLFSLNLANVGQVSTVTQTGVNVAVLSGHTSQSIGQWAVSSNWAKVYQS